MSSSSVLLLSLLLLSYYTKNANSFLSPSSSRQRSAVPFSSSLSAVRPNNNDDTTQSRRSILQGSFLPGALIALLPPSPSHAAKPNGLPLTTSPSGLKYADAKLGSGQPISINDVTTIDYSMASTAGRFPQIYTTKDKGTPYRWTMGDGSTIAGIEKAILGDVNDNIPPMLPGGIRRVIVPSNLGYEKLQSGSAKQCESGKEGAIGPIPPKEDVGAYQRWVQFYCNPRIPYQPDLVLDIKLYGGKKSS